MIFQMPPRLYKQQPEKWSSKGNTDGDINWGARKDKAVTETISISFITSYQKQRSEWRAHFVYLRSFISHPSPQSKLVFLPQILKLETGGELYEGKIKYSV